MEWVRGDELGRGNFATISLAKLTKGFDQFPPLMVVKSSVSSLSSVSLKNEKQILDRIGICPQIITCFGDGFSVEKDEEKRYNLFLEYANGGSLADVVRIHGGGGLPEFDVRRYTKAILCGLRHVHGNGFVHCDLKLSNVLVFGNGDVKIVDFGLAKAAGKITAAETEERLEWRGTPMYMSPETVNGGEYESPCDIWALGCAVVEMVAGKPAWRVGPETNIFGLMMRIGVGEEVPEIPENLSAEGKDFIRRCFVKDPRKRWTAEMLLNHPFVAGAGDTVTLKEATESPTGPFDFPEFVCSDQGSDEWSFCCSNSSPEMLSRVRRLVTGEPVDWSVMDSWVTVR
ncbi:mitogen-activated protein kinase kinase kinase 18-like isoform X1 [Benincasa hispida]|uniref:mitogen-activated protein kinase kinase kinase 18-like isoform X1 n=1 Tax=Benincasa hispida TaxID=102211 RepID=UPI0019003B1F|nr:mitogen-activated protein kinase kinase kinase 18-like isoform X1 [Benincasa hispida]